MPIRPLTVLPLLLALASAAQAQESGAPAPDEAPEAAQSEDAGAGTTEAPEERDAEAETGGSPAASPETGTGAAGGEATEGTKARETAEAPLGPGAEPSCFARGMLLTRAHYTQPADPRIAWRDIYLFDMGEAPDRQALRLTRGALDQSPYDNGPAVFVAEGRILFHSTRGAGVNASLYAMDAADADGDGLGDNLIYLGADDPELGGPDAGPGGEVVFAATGRDGQIQVHLAELDGDSLGPARQLSEGAGLRLDPQLSPDGTRVIYRHEVLSAQGPGTSALAVVPVEGGSDALLSPEGVRDSDPDFLDEGTVVFARREGEEPAEIMRATLGAEGLGDITPLTRTPDIAERHPRPSPDGACLAWIAEVPGREGAGDMVIRDMVNGETRTVTATGDIAGMDWQP